MDLSSELVHVLLPIFLVTTMGMSVAALGVLEGAAEATAMIVKLFSGPLSDWPGRRAGLLLLGYGLAVLTKPLFPLATSPAWVVRVNVPVRRPYPHGPVVRCRLIRSASSRWTHSKHSTRRSFSRSTARRQRQRG
jgi:MFS family permease